MWVTILAGGAGYRFWPLSTPARPKQLLPLASSNPLIVDTIERVRGFVPPDRLRILTGEDLVAPIREVTGLGREAFMVETHTTGTGPVLARAAWEVTRTDPDALLVSLHSDHVINPVGKFREVLAAAVEVAARENLLLTVAVPPDRPETGYGYIRPGSGMEAPGGHRAYRVDAFVEKPDRAAAAKYVEDGYRWNSGIFVWQAETFLNEVTAHAPEIARALPHLDRGDPGAFFAEAGTISVDEAVLERSARVGSIDATFRWDDIGSWEALSRHRLADESGNVCEGEVHLSDASGNIAVTGPGHGRLVLLGVDDLVVVQTDHATMVMPRARSPQIKRYLDKLPERVANPDRVRTSGPDSG